MLNLVHRLAVPGFFSLRMPTVDNFPDVTILNLINPHILYGVLWFSKIQLTIKYFLPGMNNLMIVSQKHVLSQAEGTLAKTSFLENSPIGLCPHDSSG